MKYNNQKVTEELFPNFSSFDRAINYPYFAPNYSFSFYKGEFIKGICDNLNNRIPILSVGSNRSPYQLKRKFSLNQDICVTPAILIDSDIVYAASLSAYGSIPATQWPSKGTKVTLNVLWLTEEQLNIMHLTEAIGVAYDFVKLKYGSVKIKNFNYSRIRLLRRRRNSGRHKNCNLSWILCYDSSHCYNCTKYLWSKISNICSS